jgi:hypothetical protein
MMLFGPPKRNDASTASKPSFFKNTAQHHPEPIRLRFRAQVLEQSRRTEQARDLSHRRSERVILEVRVVPQAKRNLIKKENGLIKVYLTKPAQDGRANAQLIEFLSKQLKIKKYQVRIVKGETSRHKVVEIDGDASFLAT